MALYICCKCGETFDHPFREVQDGESWDSCPECGCPDFEEASQCRGCRKDMSFSDLIGQEYCKECVDDAIRNHPELVREFMSFDDVRESFAEYLAEVHWEPWREKVRAHG